MQPATQKPGASPETQHMMSSSRTGLGPAAPPTSALGNRIQSLHHFLQGHLFMSQPEPHSPQRRTVLQPGLPLHQRCFGGGEALGRGLPRRLPGIGPEPRRGGAWGGCSAEAEAVRAPRLSAATWAPSECTPARRARRSTSAPRVQSPGAPARTRGSFDRSARAPSRRPGPSTSAPRGHLGAPRTGSPRRDLSPQPGPPLQPRVSAPSPERSGEPPRREYGACPLLPPAAPGQVQRPQQPGAPSPRRRMPPAPPPASGSVGSRWSGGRRLPKDARRRREARAQAPAPRSRHAWHEATQGILHPGALQKPVMRVPGPSAISQGGANPVCARTLTGVFPRRG